MWCWRRLETPLDCKEIQPVHPKGFQSWIFIGRTDAEADTPILWPPDAKNWFIGKDPDAGKDWRQEEKRMTENEMVGCHHQFNGYESWTIKKAEHWRTDALELWCWRKLLSPLDCKVIKPVHPKGNQPWIFIGRIDFEAETPILWPPDAKSWLIWKDPDAGKDWGRRRDDRGWDG